ncbi:glutamine--tRNA ligase/YqeY domain fusion protein [Basilea psittacipulmonis]|uniref:Glutamine--tRNA ligase n=1 Tax=Basilea psittacipulmonis DSM 24701 TaxID=1072685 RepID=A0A077DFQ3_9BURK|nr:glutamine--tRNA ligase/YqeY domain fusion protein [Basilea psittacipulmonis]AIL32182.1 glutaminyl-tRNA synthetase [Basilea psittacipulmonis DSM 24701]
MSEKDTTVVASNFLRNIIDRDLAEQAYAGKKWAGHPSDAQGLSSAPEDAAKIRTRFPPEPNGFLHIGHAKSICLNFGLAKDYAGVCHLRFDDTNPEKEDQVYVDSIKDTVAWLGYSWNDNLYFASDYFNYMYDFACALIQADLAYVDEQNADQIRENRGTLKEAGKDSPWRNRPVEESLRIFEDMKAGKYPDGGPCLRAKIDMASPNINLRDPVIYRIRHAHHHRTGDQWKIYPMYTYAHPIEDALEGITHSICTLEFEDQRPFYDWLLNHLADLGKLARPLPHQYEFSRLNLNYVVTSKRKLLQLVTEGHVSGWDDPRLPTIAGLRRRGYTPEAIRLFCERLGVSKADSTIDYSVLEQSLRDVLDPVADRAVAVLDPIKLTITNLPDDHAELCQAPYNPHDEAAGVRNFHFTKHLWIERDDFRIEPPKKYFRLFPGNTVRLKYAYVVKCTGYEVDEHGEVTEVFAEYIPDTKSGTPGADSVKVKGAITWVSQKEAIQAEVKLYDRLFKEPVPGSDDRSFLDDINPESITTVHAYLEPSIRLEKDRWQFERLGYFCLDKADRTIAKATGQTDTLVINRSVTLKDNWKK